jgi:3-aminobutyryl-CoA ammonia-lyase
VWKIGSARIDISDSAAEFLDEPILTCRAAGTTVVPKDHQRFPH